MAHTTIHAGELNAVVGDNAAHGEHRSGYNGLWSLRHATSGRNLFVPPFAGLNFEHIFNGDPVGPREIFFEPRFAPMTLKSISEREAELYQPPTPAFHLESWTRFSVSAPWYLDMQFRCVAHQHVFPRNYIGLFWASYIHSPLDKSMYFQGGLENQSTLWTQFCTQRHNDQSTVRHRDDKTELEFAPDEKDALYKNYSPHRFDTPLFYGLFEDHIWIVMFDRAEGIRLTHSPSGGGVNAALQTTNPAWDFQFIIPNYKILTEYGFRARTVFRPRCDRDQVLEEYKKWKGA